MNSEPNHKRRGRKAYLDDFQKGKNGEYEYQGSIYTYVSQGKSLTQALAALWAFSLAAFACALIAGFLPAVGTNGAFYTLIPYAATLVLLIAHVWALCRLTANRNQLREYIYLATVKRMGALSICTSIGAALTILGYCIHLIMCGLDGHVFDIVVFILLMFSIFSISLCIHHRICHMKWSK